MVCSWRNRERVDFAPTRRLVSGMKHLRWLVMFAAVGGGAMWGAEDGPGFSAKHMDPAVSPAEDFAKFAAGGWYARTTMPADKSRWGGFSELAERNWADLHAILKE